MPIVRKPFKTVLTMNEIFMLAHPYQAKDELWDFMTEALALRRSVRTLRTVDRQHDVNLVSWDPVQETGSLT